MLSTEIASGALVYGASNSQACYPEGNKPARNYRGGGLPDGGGGELKSGGGDEISLLLFGGGSLVTLPNTGTRWPLAYMHCI